MKRIIKEHPGKGTVSRAKIKQAVKDVITQKHHIIYGGETIYGKLNPEVTANIRKGCHQVITLIKRYKYLTTEEIWAIMLEALLKWKKQ